ncbi:hypothetical protein L596_012441 [Steinernema carpocapsae]|uniref:F-box associated domain-containing protein n=1 Tax=Steinernema carpocapsae TaxID=34508 RepID=A0A4V6A4T1_STECR|nr:hypothetical protein L596_012441 [Steinernema carpocapsae]
MSCLINDFILRDLLSMCNRNDHQAIETTDPNWRSILHSVQAEKSAFNAYFSVSQDSLSYHFCNEDTSMLDNHKHLDSLSEQHVKNVKTLYLGAELYCDPYSSVEKNAKTIEEGEFPQFPNLQVGSFYSEAAFDQLIGKIPLNFQHVSIDDADLEDLSCTAFLAQVLKSDALKSLELDDVKLGSQTWAEVGGFLKSAQWETLKLQNYEDDQARNLQMDSSILEFFEVWKKSSDPKQKWATLGIRPSRGWCQLKEHFGRLGKEIEDDQDVIFEIAHTRKGIKAVASLINRPRKVKNGVQDDDCTELEILFEGI